MEKRVSRRSAGGLSPSFILHVRVLLLLAFAVFISGCAPPGPRALVAGKKLLDRGDYAGAVAQLKTATALLATNAAAWNYYGVALQHAGQSADAALAYQNALRFDRDLVEAHYNLGCLWMEQDKPDAARTEFTAYTLRRNNTPDGWLKLGAAQLELHDLHSAETSFSTALSLSPNNAGALNGLGLASVERARPLDAAKFFSAAVQSHPDYAPALLNLATVEDEYLRDDATALKNYRAYLAMSPRPADWSAVNELVSRLEQAPVLAAKAPPATEEEIAVPEKPGAVETKPPASPAARSSPPPKAPPVRNASPLAHPQPATEVVAVQPETAIATAPSAPPPEPNLPAETPPETATARNPGVMHRLNPVHWFASSTSSPSYPGGGVTPLTPINPAPAPAAPPPAPAPVKMTPPAPPVFPRYLYLSPRKPKAGDRKAAARAFAEAQQFEHQDDLAQAVNSYRQAAELDPAWFEAQYNCAVLAYRVQDLKQALAASEMALAIRPDSGDARYNFALALKTAGYALDALNELKKIVAANPDDARAQLALGNLYAEQMRDLAQARQHYVKWLALDPHNPQADNIRYWLSANPQ